MKIYIETEMTELPKGCGDCPNRVNCRETQRVKEFIAFDHSVDDDTALANLENFERQISINRPSWCPLRTATEIANKAKENE